MKPQKINKKDITIKDKAFLLGLLNTIEDISEEANRETNEYRKLLQRLQSISENISDKEVACKVISQEISSLDISSPEHQKETVVKKTYRWSKVAITSIVFLTLLFTTFFGGVVFSKEFRHTVFNVLEGNGKFSVTTVFADQALSAEELSTVMRPIALDGQGYSVLASGDLQHNYTLVYQKNGEEIVFDVQRGMTQAYFDSDHTTWSQSSVNGQPAYFCEQKSRNTISVFMQGGLVCTVSGSMGEARLIRLASSISIR